VASTSSEFMYFVFQLQAAVFCTLLSFHQVQDQQSCLSSAYTCIYIRSLNMVSMYDKTLTRLTSVVLICSLLIHLKRSKVSLDLSSWHYHCTPCRSTTPLHPVRFSSPISDPWA
jgi:hypothetical protein